MTPGFDRVTGKEANMETTDSGQETTGPATRRGGSARAGLLGAVVGAGALVGGLVLATGGAGAQPTTAGSAAAPAPADEVVLVDGEAMADEEFFAELDEAWENYEACLVDNGLIDERELEALELEAIEEGDVDEYELDEGDWDDEYLESGAVMLVEDENGSTLVEFGDGDGAVTVSKVDGEVAVTTDGDVEAETFTWDELEAEFDHEGDWDEAFEVCDDVLEDVEELEDDYFEEYDAEEGDEYVEAEELEGDED